MNIERGIRHLASSKEKIEDLKSEYKRYFQSLCLFAKKTPLNVQEVHRKEKENNFFYKKKKIH